MEELVNPQYCTFRLANVKATKAYIKNLRKYYQDHWIFPRLLQIDRELRDSTSEETKQKWISKACQLDKQRTLLKLAAAKKCAKQHLTKTYPYSEKLAHAGQAITYWKGRKDGILFHQPLHPYLDRLRIDLQIQDNDSSNLRYVQQQLEAAWKYKRSLHDDTASIRHEFLKELAEYQAAMKNIKMESVLKQLRNAEESRNGHKNIDWYLKPHERGSVSSVLIPDGIEIQYKKDAMANGLRLMKFWQAHMPWHIHY